MPDVNVHLSNVAGTEAAMGWAGSHTIVADRPEGKAGGMGLGFNGAELLALAVSGCFCNDLRYVAHKRDAIIDGIRVDVSLTVEGDPPIATSPRMMVTCEVGEGVDAAALIDEARSSCMVSNSISQGIPVSISMSS